MNGGASPHLRIGNSTKFGDSRFLIASSPLYRENAPLSFIRSMLQRGNLEQARTAIEEFKKSLKNEENISLSLVVFEEAKLEAFENNWEHAIACVTRSLELGAPSVAQLPLLQVRAVANFELGKYVEASRDVEAAEQLGKAFPDSPASLFMHTLKVKISARTHGVEEAWLDLNAILEKRLQSNKIDLNLLLTFLRVRIDLSRLCGRPYWKESVVCYLIADAISDPLYAGLAKLDFFSSLSRDLSELLEYSKSLGQDFMRIGKFRLELEGKTYRSTTAQTFLTTIGTTQHPDAGSVEMLAEGNFAKVVILIKEMGLVVDLGRNKLIVRPPVSQCLKALEVIGRAGEAGISKRDFFATLWGRQTYNSSLHDGLISNLLNRLKKECGIDLQDRDAIRCPRKFIIL